MKLSNISKTYISKTKDTTKAITNVSLSFSIGLTVIAGPSGSGKTTLLNIISGFLAPDSGEIIFNDKDLSKLSTKEQRELRLHDVGYYLSDKNLIEHLTVYENIILSRKLINKSINQEELMAILIKLGIDNLLNRYPSELSTGQKSRVGLARLMVKKPKLLLADEPTGALDELTSILVMDCLKELSKTSMVIIVTHDETLAKHYADRIIRLRKGIIESDSSDSIEIIKTKTTEHNSKIPYRVLLSQTLSSFKYKKTKLMLATFILSLILLFITSSLLVIRNDFSKNYLMAAKEDKVEYTSFRKDSFYKVEGVLQERSAYFTRNDYNFLKQITNEDVLYAIDNPTFNNQIRTNLLEHGYPNYKLEMPVNDALIETLGYELKYGRMPETTDETMISLLYADLILSLGKPNLGIDSYNDLVDEETILPYVGNVVGIIDTGLRKEDVITDDSDLMPLLEIDPFHLTKFSCETCLFNHFSLDYLSTNYGDKIVVDYDKEGIISKTITSIMSHDYVTENERQREPLYDNLVKSESYAIIHISSLDDLTQTSLISGIETLKYQQASDYVESNYEALKEQYDLTLDKAHYLDYILTTSLNEYTPGIDRHYFNQSSYQSVIEAYLSDNPVNVTITIETESGIKSKELEVKWIDMSSSNSRSIIVDNGFLNEFMNDVQTPFDLVFISNDLSEDALKKIISLDPYKDFKTYSGTNPLYHRVENLSEFINSFRVLALSLGLVSIVLFVLFIYQYTTFLLEKGSINIGLYLSLGLTKLNIRMIYAIEVLVLVIISGLISLLGHRILVTQIQRILSNRFDSSTSFINLSNNTLLLIGLIGLFCVTLIYLILSNKVLKKPLIELMK